MFGHRLIVLVSDMLSYMLKSENNNLEEQESEDDLDSLSYLEVFRNSANIGTKI